MGASNLESHRIVGLSKMVMYLPMVRLRYTVLLWESGIGCQVGYVRVALIGAAIKDGYISVGLMW